MTKLTREQLLEKFPILKVFADSSYMEGLTNTGTYSYQESVFHITKFLLKECLDKYSNYLRKESGWTSNFSLSVRLQQILDCIEELSQPDVFELTVKNQSSGSSEKISH